MTGLTFLAIAVMGCLGLWAEDKLREKKHKEICWKAWGRDRTELMEGADLEDEYNRFCKWWEGNK